jgi:hypothetical protein
VVPLMNDTHAELLAIAQSEADLILSNNLSKWLKGLAGERLGLNLNDFHAGSFASL